MPGSAINSAIAYLKPDGSLHIGMYVMRGAEVVEQNMDRAIKRIRNGERPVTVWVYGRNIETLLKAFALSTEPNQLSSDVSPSE